MLLLSDDVLLDVLRNIPRGWLDQMTTSNRTIRIGVSRISAPSNSGPKRRITMDSYEPTTTTIRVLLMTCDPDIKEPTLIDFFNGAQVNCRWTNELNHAIRDCVVVNVAFYSMRPGLHQLFMPLVHRWRNGNVYSHPLHFDSLIHFMRFFNQLAVTTGALKIDLHRQSGFEITAPLFWDLGAVKHCTQIEFRNMPQEALVSGAELLTWLKIRRGPSKVKHVCITNDALTPGMKDFINAFKTDFKHATVPCRFTVKIRYLQRHQVPHTDTSLTNAHTGEHMDIINEHCSITIKRHIP